MKFFLLYQLFRLPAAFVLDALLGDPAWFPHPVVWLGKLIAHLERLFRSVFPQSKWGERCAGAVVALVTCAYAFGVSFLILYALFYAGIRFNNHIVLGVAYGLDLFWGYQCLAARNLRDEADHVFVQVSRSVSEGRTAVARIVGRDTAFLDKKGIIKACVETVAESTTDGVVSPMIAFAAGGAPLALLYKAINTMDSMIGYKNDRYRYFGTVAARLDDVANFIPARVASLCMMAGAFFLHLPSLFSRHAFRYSPVRAARTFLRDRYQHQSPNSAQTESTCAGALGVQLGGDAWYEGLLEHKPTLGKPLREPEIADIHRAVMLMYAASLVALFAVFAVRLATIVARFNPAWF